MPVDLSLSQNLSSGSSCSVQGNNGSYDTFDAHQMGNAVELSLSNGSCTSWPRTRAVQTSIINDARASPLQRYTSEEPDTPWNPVQVAGISPTTPKGLVHLSKYPSDLAVQYPTAPKSDHGSKANETDEGYHSLSTKSQPDAGSVFSAPISDMYNGQQKNKPCLGAPPASNLQAVPEASVSGQIYLTQVGQFGVQPEHQLATQSHFSCNEPGCDWEGKTSSDYKSGPLPTTH